MLPDIITKLIRVANGDIIAIASLADEVAGGHVKNFFATTQAKLDKATNEDTRDALLEMMKQVGYNATAFLVSVEVLQHLHEDVEAMRKIAEKWKDSEAPQPDLRDVVVGATAIAPAFAASTGPLRAMYIIALRGSYTPEIFKWGYSRELLESMIYAKLLPSDIDVLAEVTQSAANYINLKKMTKHTVAVEFDPYERLATGGFIDMRQDRGTPLFVTARTQATCEDLEVRATPKGRRLLTMMQAGRGEA